METEVERLIVRLTGDAEQYLRMLQQAQSGTQQAAQQVQEAANKIEGITNSIKGFAAGAVQALTALGAGMWLQRALSAWGQAEDAVIDLRATLRANERDVDRLTARYAAFATQIQEVTAISDEATLANVTMAESFGLTGDAAEQAVRDAIGLARAARTSAEAMIRLTAAVASGDIERAMMFSRMVPQLRGIRDEQEFLQRYARLTASGFDAVRESANTATGRLRGLNEAFGDLLEMFGQVFAEAVIPVVKILKDAVAWMQSWDQSTKRVIVSVVAAAAAFLALGTAINVVKLLLSAVLNPLTIVIGTVGVLMATWGDFRDLIIDVFISAEFTVRNFGQVCELVWTSIQFGFFRAVDFMQELWTGFIASLRQGITGLSSLFGGLDEVLDAPAAATSETTERLREQMLHLRNALAMDFAQFRNMRRAALFGDNAEPTQVRQRAEILGGEIGKGINAGLGKEMGRVDAALRHSAEAMARIAAYKDLFLEVKGTRGAASAAAASSAAAAPMTAAGRAAASAAAGGVAGALSPPASSPRTYAPSLYPTSPSFVGPTLGGTMTDERAQQIVIQRLAEIRDVLRGIARSPLAVEPARLTD